MSLRKFRNVSQAEHAHREAADTVDYFRRIVRPFGSRHSFSERNRNLDRGKPYMKQLPFEGGFRIERSRSSSFSTIVHDPLSMPTRRQSVGGGRRPMLPNKQWSPMKVYPGEAVGYRRLWMQNNPWPDQVSKETGSRREGGHDHMHRMKFREPKRHYQEPDFVPGGNHKDPLNLSGYMSDVFEKEFMSGPVPAQRPDLYLPVNNFIPINEHDPLGLTQNEDVDMTLCLKYSLKPKRKRSRTKKKENVSSESSASHSQVDCGDGVGTATDTTSARVNREARGSGTRDHGQALSGNSSKADSEGKEDCDLSAEHASSADSSRFDAEDSSVKENMECSEVSENVGHSSQTVTSRQVDQQKSGEEISDNTGHEAVTVPAETDCNINTDDSIQPGTSGGIASHEREIERMDEDSDHNPVDDRGFDELKKRGLATHFRNRSGSLQQGKRDYRKHNRDQMMLKEVQQRAQSFRTEYPVPQSPMDEAVKKHLASNRKSLKKALRITPMKPEEQEKVIREREQKKKEFKKLWRPNLKSPEEKEESDPASQQSSSKVLTIDTKLLPDKTVQETQLYRGSVSRTVDSIISPVLRPDASRVGKRRRTNSECSAEPTSKKLTFRRSISPQQGTSVSPRKIRRQTSGSGQEDQKTESEEKPQNTIKYSKNPAYKHGNYYRYYGYRMPAMAPDFRLYHFRKDWFEGKDVLDIGCNAGDVTLAVAQFFHPQKIVGMDIDPNLIRIARQNIRSHQTKANMYQMEKYPVSTTEYGPIEPLPALTNASNIFPKNVMFMQGNYVLKSDEELDYVKPEYDTILALSITKWIHLNHGDEGLKRVFHRMFQQLRPGGRLILEPQTWASYRRRKKLTATIYKNYNSIQLKPNDFADYLVNTVGFCKRECLGTPFNPSKGFQRSLWLFTKYKPTADNSPYPSVSPAQYPSINERITYLAGYSPNRRGDFPHHSTSSPNMNVAGYSPFRYGPYPPYFMCQNEPGSHAGIRGRGSGGRLRDSESLMSTSIPGVCGGGDESFSTSTPTPRVGGGNDESFGTSSSSCSSDSSRGSTSQDGIRNGVHQHRQQQGQQLQSEEQNMSLESCDMEKGAMDWQEENSDMGQVGDEGEGQVNEEDTGQLGEQDNGQGDEEDIGPLGEKDLGQHEVENLGQYEENQDLGQLGEDIGQLGDGEEDMGQFADDDMGPLHGLHSECNGDIDHHTPEYSPDVEEENPSAQGDFYDDSVNFNDAGTPDDPVVGGGAYYGEDSMSVGGYGGSAVDDVNQEQPAGDNNQDSLLNAEGIYAAEVDDMITLAPELDGGSSFVAEAEGNEESSFPEGSDQSEDVLEDAEESGFPEGLEDESQVLPEGPREMGFPVGTEDESQALPEDLEKRVFPEGMEGQLLSHPGEPQESSFPEGSGEHPQTVLEDNDQSGFPEYRGDQSHVVPSELHSLQSLGEDQPLSPVQDFSAGQSDPSPQAFHEVESRGPFGSSSQTQGSVLPEASSVTSGGSSERLFPSGTGHSDEAAASSNSSSPSQQTGDQSEQLPETSEAQDSGGTSPSVVACDAVSLHQGVSRVPTVNTDCQSQL